MARKTVLKTRAELARKFDRSERVISTWLGEGMPGAPGAYVLEDCVEWLDRRGDKRKATSQTQGDDLGDEADSPALERYRLARAQMEELKLARLRSELVESEHIQQWLQSFSLLLRGFGEKLAKIAPEIVPDLEGVLEQAGETLEKVVRQYGDGDADE